MIEKNGKQLVDLQDSSVVTDLQEDVVTKKDKKTGKKQSFRKRNTNKSSKKKRRSSVLGRKARAGFLFVLPWLIGFAIFVFWPMIQSFWYSLNTVRIRPTGRVFRFTGVSNYQNVWLKDMMFVQELGSFLISTLLRVPIIIIFALMIAMLLNGRLRFKGTFRTIFFLPVIIASGPVMNELVNQGATSVPLLDQSSINQVLTSVLPIWLATPISDLFGQIITVLWYSGVQILIFIAGLQKIDKSLYEAAKIDGGSGWECFWKITLPMLKPMILLNAVFTIVTLANNGQNNIINLIYNNMFAATRGYGFASAQAWMYAVIVFAIVGIVFFAFRESSPKEKHAKKKRHSRVPMKKGSIKKAGEAHES